MTTNAIISVKVANYALYYFDNANGFSGGYFSDSFYALCAHADNANLDRLALGFPAEVAAFRLGRETVGGLEMLRTIAGIR